MEDQEILQLIKTDYNKGYTLLVKLYQKKIYWHVRRFVFDHDDANDVTQNVFIKIFNNLVNFKGESKLYSWIYRIASNESIDFINQKSRKNRVSFEAISYQAAQNLIADSFFEGDEISLKLQMAVAKLPEKQRIVFQMKYFEEMKYEDISEILQVTVGGLKASYHHAVKKIQKMVAEKLF